MQFSYSNLNTFQTCRAAWKYIYINCVERQDNFFSQHGKFSHEILEKYFKNELESYELAEFYKNNYHNKITLLSPPYPPNMAENYYQNGLSFFENFKFDKSKYNILGIEDSIETKFLNTKFIVKPDIYLQNKNNGIITLLDYKSSKYKKKKEEEYRHQLEIYSYFIWIEKNIEINKIFVWFLRENQFIELKTNPFAYATTLQWIEDSFEAIKKEENFEPNLSKENKYFCNFICGCSNICEYRNNI